MTCINKNTVFYKTLVDGKYDPKEIAKINLALESESFIQWYGLGERDTFSNPVIIKDIYLQNDKGEQITLNNLLNGEPYEKRKYYKADLTYIDKVDKLLGELRIGIATRINNFKGTDYSKALKNLLEEIDKLDKTDFVNALNKHTEYILKTVTALEDKFVAFDKVNKSKLSKEELTKNDEDFKNFLLQSNSFLETFSKIDQLEDPKIEGLEIGKLIKLLKDTENRVTDLRNRIDAEVEAHIRNKLEKLIKNPEIRSGVIDFLAAQSDESGIQRWLDALGDSHVPFLAAVDKYYKLNMAEKDEERDELLKDWRKFVASKSDFKSFLNNILEYKDGKSTGRFIQEFDEQYYDELFDYRSQLKDIEKTKGKDSKEYKELATQYFKWRRENTQQKYVDDYYKTLDLLTPIAREAREDIDKKKSTILSKGVDKLSLEDWDELKKLEDEMKQLKSSVYPDGSKKTGDDLAISKSLFKYSQALSKFYETKGIRQKDFDRAKEDAKEKGDEYLAQWLKNNTSEQYSDRFWELFNNLVSQFPDSKPIQDVREEIKQLLLSYRNERGEIKVEDLPDNIKKELKELESKKAALKKSLNIKIDRELSSKFRNLVHFVPSKYYLETYKQKQDDLASGKITKEQYDNWFNTNHETNEYTEEINPISIWTVMKPRNSKFVEVKPNSLWKISDIKPQFNNPDYREDSNGYPLPKEKWINSEYSKLTSENKEGLDKINELLSYLVEHSKNNIIKQGYLPAIPKDIRGIFDTLRGKPIAKEETDSMATITETDQIVKHIPFKYIRKLNTIDLNQDIFKVKEGMTEEEIEKVKEERKKALKENKLAHGESLDYDLENTMEKFIASALTNKYKSRMELDVKLFREQLKHLKIKQTNSAGKPLYNRIKSQLAGENVQHEVNAIGSNTEKHFNDWLDAVFYEDFNLEEGKLTEWANKIQNFTSLRAMGFNVLSGVNNSIMGNMNNRIEAAGGRFYTAKDYRNANKLYFGNITNFIADMKKDESSNYLTAFIKEMDILVSQDELASKPEGWLATAQHKLRMVKDAAYFMQHIGEHQVQNVSLIAMANSHRIVDGEILSFNEFFEKNKLNISDIAKNESKEAALAAIEENAKLKKELLEKFETYTKVIDAYELNNGYAELKKDLGITKEDIFEFKQRVIGINQKLHGIYNTEDAGMIQRHALGRLAIQFRKWMRPGWNKRFGAKFGKKIYNEKIRDYEQGMYVTTAKYLSSPFVTSWQENKKNQANIALVAYKTLVDGFKDTIFNAKIRWHSMTEIEKANVRRTATEFLFFISVTSLGFLAKHLKGEDDDDEKMKTKMLVFTLYQADRLFGELTNFTPIGVVREGNRLFSSPSPVFNTFEDIGKLGTALFLYPFRDEKERQFNSGTYYGQDRVSVYAQDLMPFWNQFKRLGNMNANNQRYGIFR